MRIVEGSLALEAVEVDEKTLHALNEDRLRILRALAKSPLYAAELSRLLRMHPQTVYYNLRLLAKERLIALKGFEEKHGGIAKKYVATAEALALPLSEKWRPFGDARRKVPSFLSGFVKDGFLDAKIIVGSPEPHGKYRSRGSEFPAIELAAFLSQYSSFQYPLYYLDTEAHHSVRQENLFLVGGPKVNTLVQEANASLPIRFSSEFDIVSTVSGKKYGDDVGVIQSAPSPFAEGKNIFVVAGSSHHATRVAVLALIKHPKKIDSGPFAHVVQGFDEDGDGIVDAVEVLE